MERDNDSGPVKVILKYFVKLIKMEHHRCFMEFCRFINVVPNGLRVRNIIFKRVLMKIIYRNVYNRRKYIFEFSMFYLYTKLVRL